MKDRTPEEVAADNALDEAINRMAKAGELVADDEVVTAWVVVGAAQGPDYGRTSYFHAFPGGTLPSHTAVGLLRLAEQEILAHGEDDDD
jgi:hypothetical protein